MDTHSSTVDAAASLARADQLPDPGPTLDEAVDHDGWYPGKAGTF